MFLHWGVWYSGSSLQAPAIISFQIENGKFIEKIINLSFHLVDIRKFTLSILKQYRKDGPYDKKTI